MPVVWSTQGPAWLMGQFTEKPALAALLGAFMAELQSIEDLWEDLATLTALGTATGAQLDIWGVLLGYPRESGQGDVSYRATLLAVVRARASHGATEDLLATLDQLIAADVDRALVESFPAAARLVIVGQTYGYADGRRAAAVAARAAPPGVNFALEYAPSDAPVVTFEEDTFHAPVTWHNEDQPGSGGVFAEEDPGRW